MTAFVTVPREPTPEMLAAAEQAISEGANNGTSGCGKCHRTAWDAMLRAAPQPPASVPVAWFRVVRSNCDHEGAPMYEPEMHWHWQRPNGEGWAALYAAPTASADEGREVEELFSGVIENAPSGGPIMRPNLYRLWQQCQKDAELHWDSLQPMYLFADRLRAAMAKAPQP